MAGAVRRAACLLLYTPAEERPSSRVTAERRRDGRGPDARGSLSNGKRAWCQELENSMGRRLYVGNLPYSATEDQLSELFSRAGKVDTVRVMRDMATGRARGFAFVEMGTDEEAQKAISEFHEQQMDGRALVVNEARPKPEGGFGGGGAGRGRGGGGGGRSYDDENFAGGRRKEPRW
jgi:RNA recognition motif-containing protein